MKYWEYNEVSTAHPQPQLSQPTFVLDTSAIIRYLEREAGSSRVNHVLKQCSDRQCRVLVSAVNWGELATKLYNNHSPAVQEFTMKTLLSLGIEVVAATAERAVNSGRIKARLAVPYADAFGVELALDSPNRTLITADFDVKPAASEVNIEFLPAK